MRSSDSKLKSPPLGQDAATENPEVFDITAEQTARLLNQAIDPLKSAASHPNRGARYLACKEIDCCAYAGGDRDTKSAIMHRNPFLLFGAAKGDQEQIRLGGEDARFDFIAVHLDEFVERRRIVTGDEQVG